MKLTQFDYDLAYDVGYERALQTFSRPMTVAKMAAISAEGAYFAGGRDKPLYYSFVAGHMYGREAARLRRPTPYPWCPQPEICCNKGSCPRDPNCGE